MRSDPARNRRSAGFTLIEVMAALVIVSLGMLAVIQAVSQTANNTAYLRDKTLAHWVAMNRLTEIRLSEQPPPIGENSGEVEMGGRRWRWETTITNTAVATMRRIDVGVSTVADALSDDEEAAQLTVLTGFFGAKIAPAGTVKAQFDAIPPQSPTSSSGSSGGQPSSGSGSGSSGGSSSGGGG
jgi:general secretion pathway protein I